MLPLSGKFRLIVIAESCEKTCLFKCIDPFVNCVTCIEFTFPFPIVSDCSAGLWESFADPAQCMPNLFKDVTSNLSLCKVPKLFLPILHLVD